MNFLYIKKHPILSTVFTGVVIIIFLSIVFSGNKDEKYETIVVSRDNLVQSVEVTGKVQPTEERILAFERSGTVGHVYVAVGDHVSRWQRLVSLDSSELYAQLKQAEASISQQQNTLKELKRGSRPEELALSYTAVDNAQKAVDNAQNAYNIAVEKADIDLHSAYDSAITSAQSGVVSAKNALVSLSEIQYTRFNQAGVSDDDLASKKSIAIESLFNVQNAGGWTAESVSGISGGVYDEIQSVTNTSDTELYITIANVLTALNATADALESMPVLSTFSTTEKTELSAQKTTISAAVVSLSAKLQLIDIQKVANTSSIATAETALTTAESSLLQAENELTLKKAGNTEEAIATGESLLSAAVAQKEFIEAQIRTTVLTSPIDGIVTKQDAEQGVFTRAGTPVLSVISDGSYEVEVFIPEVDIAKINIGDDVNITLDAYTEDDIFEATVTSIDPAETIIEGVSTYKVVLSFVVSGDERIKSGMTADADIMTDKKENVVVVPSRLIKSTDGYKYIQVVSDNGKIEERKVTVGLKGSDGYSEIVDGLSEGEIIATFVRK